MERDNQNSCNHECETCTVDHSEQPWECDVCLYQHGDAPPRGLACLRCKQVLNIFDRIQKEREKEPATLVDRLHRMVGCEYLSSLKEHQFKAPLLKAIGQLEAGSYPFQEWSSALSYVFEEEVQITSAETLGDFLAAKREQLCIRYP